MSYCVNCGVELDASAKKCPLCNTPVMNPNVSEEAVESAPSPFPKESGMVEEVNRKDFGIIISMFVLATSVICGLLNLYVFRQNQWSLVVIGCCITLWVLLLPIFIIRKLPAFFSILFDGFAVCLYLYFISFLTKSDDWLLGLGIPITLWTTAVILAFYICVRYISKSFLPIALYFFVGAGILCGGIESLIDRYLHGAVELQWSAIVMTVCAILDVTIIAMLSRRGVRNEVRRRLHF